MSEPLKFTASDIPLIAVIAISGFLFIDYFALILSSDPLLLVLIFIAFVVSLYEMHRTLKRREK